ncbi:MerR family transcriptional regulator [Chakrabartyella piscis]|uniref:MerR family transcriptional regulator n=1 Tax=Chakrabartyella piscis TaxID=2918914 RepID=UPI00295847AF|nr:MerR family transcriptional regulator [Chakrabartyella piscis]
MKKFFSIGEAAKINNISTKTLQHYASIGLIVPRHIAKNGYRYYTYDQFWHLDKIKRYKRLGFSLSEIKTFFDTQSTEIIENHLTDLRTEYREETKRLLNNIKDATWLKDYYNYGTLLSEKTMIYPRTMSERIAVYTTCTPTELVYRADMRLREIVHQHNEIEINLRTPYDYILNIHEMKNGRFVPTHALIELNKFEDCHEYNDHIMQIPQGTYYCFPVFLLSNNPDFSIVNDYIQQIGLDPKFVICSEYQTKLHDLESSPYEVQILF